MSHVIIGTAGHIDHGKTALVRALTSRDPDRLIEEKKRGITIDLGFTWLDLPDGTKSGLIDVPGHEHFIRNMLAGAGSVDLALLAVAADEGVMPQTVEHIGILHLLGVRWGVIALTRCDLADEAMKQRAEKEVRAHTRGTFLENAPIVRTSARTGEGIEALRETLFDAVRRAQSERPSRVDHPFRLPVDRVFTVDGFGTVVTGTVTDGTLRRGDAIRLYPGDQTARVRAIEVHDQPEESVEAGQRAALNLTGVRKYDLSRGAVAAEEGSLFASRCLDVSLSALRDTHFEIKNNLRVHVHLYTATAVGRIVLLDRDKLAPGDAAPAQLRLETPLFARYGDHVIVRFFSPLETIGGGMVVDPLPPKRKRVLPADARVSDRDAGARSPDERDGQRGDFRAFDVMKSGDPGERLMEVINQNRDPFVDLARTFYRAGVAPGDQAPLLEKLVERGDVIRLDDRAVIAVRQLEALARKAAARLEDYEQSHPLEGGMRREAFQARLLHDGDPSRADRVTEELLRRGTLEEKDGQITLPNRRVHVSRDDARAIDAIESFFLKSSYRPPPLEAWIDAQDRTDNARQRVGYLLRRGILVPLAPDLVMHRKAVDRALALAVRAIRRDGSLKLSDFRTWLVTTRRTALALLEHFDKIKVTKRRGDVRVLGPAAPEKP